MSPQRFMAAQPFGRVDSPVSWYLPARHSGSDGFIQRSGPHGQWHARCPGWGALFACTRRSRGQLVALATWCRFGPGWHQDNGDPWRDRVWGSALARAGVHGLRSVALDTACPRMGRPTGLTAVPLRDREGSIRGLESAEQRAAVHRAIRGRPCALERTVRHATVLCMHPRRCLLGRVEQRRLHDALVPRYSHPGRRPSDV